MYRRLFICCVLNALGAGWSAVAVGQNFVGSSGTSAFGSGFGSGFGSMGLGGFGTSGFGNAGFGATRFGSGGMGGFGSGFGTSGFGNAGFGATRFGTGRSGLGGSVFGNQTTGLGGNAGQNFVGRNAADMQATFNQMGRAGTQFFNRMNRDLRRRAINRAAPPASSAKAVEQPMRVDLQVAFAVSRPSAAAIENRLRTRLGKILAEHGIAQPVVTMEGDTAVLSGLSATESQRLVLEKLIAMEPGVRQVRNEMVVIPPDDTNVPPAGN